MSLAITISSFHDPVSGTVRATARISRSSRVDDSRRKEEETLDGPFMQGLGNRRKCRPWNSAVRILRGSFPWAGLPRISGRSELESEKTSLSVSLDDPARDEAVRRFAIGEAQVPRQTRGP